MHIYASRTWLSSLQLFEKIEKILMQSSGWASNRPNYRRLTWQKHILVLFIVVYELWWVRGTNANDSATTAFATSIIEKRQITCTKNTMKLHDNILSSNSMMQASFWKLLWTLCNIDSSVVDTIRRNVSVFLLTDN